MASGSERSRGNTIPDALTWLNNNQPLEDGSTYHWILLAPSSSRAKLANFIKKEAINGQDLETCRTPKKGKVWKSSKIYFGNSSLCHSLAYLPLTFKYT